MRYQVAVGGHLILVDEPHQRGETAIPEGTRVLLTGARTWAVWRLSAELSAMGKRGD